MGLGGFFAFLFCELMNARTCNISNAIPGLVPPEHPEQTVLPANTA